MSTADDMRHLIAAELRNGESIGTPITVDLTPGREDDGWTPPALNDGPLLKAQITAAIKGEPIPGQEPAEPSLMQQINALRAEINAHAERTNNN